MSGSTSSGPPPCTGLPCSPIRLEFAAVRLTPQEKEITIGKFKYRADISEGAVIETGAKGTKKYKIEHVLGGKNVYLLPHAA